MVPHFDKQIGAQSIIFHNFKYLCFEMVNKVNLLATPEKEEMCQQYKQCLS